MLRNLPSVGAVCVLTSMCGDVMWSWSDSDDIDMSRGGGGPDGGGEFGKSGTSTVPSGP